MDERILSIEKKFGLRKECIGWKKLNAVNLEGVTNQKYISTLCTLLNKAARVTITGQENIPAGPFILAMNHTDRYSSVLL